MYLTHRHTNTESLKSLVEKGHPFLNALNLTCEDNQIKKCEFSVKLFVFVGGN